MEFLEQLLGTDLNVTMRTLIAFAIVLILIFVVAWVFRRLSYGSVRRPRRGRVARLAVLEAIAIDQRRRLVLLRRDNTEHLVMIGGAGDVVIEQGIQRVTRPHGARAGERPDFPARAGASAPPRNGEPAPMAATGNAPPPAPKAPAPQPRSPEPTRGAEAPRSAPPPAAARPAAPPPPSPAPVVTPPPAAAPSVAAPTAERPAPRAPEPFAAPKPYQPTPQPSAPQPVRAAPSSPPSPPSSAPAMPAPAAPPVSTQPGAQPAAGQSSGGQPASRPGPGAPAAAPAPREPAREPAAAGMSESERQLAEMADRLKDALKFPAQKPAAETGQANESGPNPSQTRSPE